MCDIFALAIMAVLFLTVSALFVLVFGMLLTSIKESVNERKRKKEIDEWFKNHHKKIEKQLQEKRNDG